jgi:hypothetical protein
VAWLIRDAEVLATVESGDPEGSRADTVRLLRRPWLIRLDPAGALDVAWCRVAPTRPPTLEVCRLATRRGPLPAFGRRAPVVIVAADGAFSRWGLAPGDRLEIAGE